MKHRHDRAPLGAKIARRTASTVRATRRRGWVAGSVSLVALSAACGGGDGPSGGSGGASTGSHSTSSSSPSSGSSGPHSSSTAAEIATALGRGPHFLIGMGNDLANDHSQDGAYTL